MQDNRTCSENLEKNLLYCSRLCSSVINVNRVQKSFKGMFVCTVLWVLHFQSLCVEIDNDLYIIIIFLYEDNSAL